MPSLVLLGTFALALLLALTSCSHQAEAPRPSTEHIPLQAFSLNADSAQVIQGANGSIYAIPAGAFMDSLGNPISGEVRFMLKEANDMRTIVAGDLITRTGNDLLATGGMYMIDALQDEQSLMLNPDKPIYAYFPTAQKDPDMRLWLGDFSDEKTDWKPLETPEGGIPDCDAPALKRKCQKCERLVKLAGKIRAGKKPGAGEYYAKRYYWDHGKLYYYSSGSSRQVLSQNDLDDCRDYLESRGRGRKLLSMVEEIRQEQEADAGEYYAFRLEKLGWYNCDKLVKDELKTFVASIKDSDGNLVRNAQVHLVAKDPDLQIHTRSATEEGILTYNFIPQRRFTLLAYSDAGIGKMEVSFNEDGEHVGSIYLKPLEPGMMDAFLDELL